MPIHSLASDRAAAFRKWLGSLSLSPAKGFASGVLFALFLLVAALPLIFGKFVMAALVLGMGAAVFLYNFRK